MKILARMIVALSVVACAMFIPAGHLQLPWFWAVLLIYVVMMATAGSLLDPGLIRERVAPGPGGIDRNLRPYLALLFLIQLLIAGLDAGRYHWSDRMPAVVQAAGLVTFAGGLALGLWAMKVNRFFSPVVRIQQERGHQLVSGGPYRWIRHPGYAAMLLATSMGIALGSWWSMVPMIPACALIVRRTWLEDRFLTERLPGYAAFAGEVRYRLFPGLW